MHALTRLPTPPAASPQRVALRWVAGLVLLCLLMQALLIPAQRINERTHFHLSSNGSSAWTAPTPSQSVARAVFAHRRDVGSAAAHDEALAHQHTALQDHDHGARADVVYVGDQETPAASHHAAGSKRLLLDQDGLWAALLAVIAISVARVAHVNATAHVGTRNELPLERPPRF
ncbi:hypothetical protein BH11PSE10_BH11PSE10_15470 [soil metagenome]